MRTTLIDWMNEVCLDYCLKRETFHLSIIYLDIYLSKIPNIKTSFLQLIGLVSLFTASKIEEVYTPKIEDFSLCANNNYSLE